MICSSSNKGEELIGDETFLINKLWIWAKVSGALLLGEASPAIAPAMAPTGSPPGELLELLLFHVPRQFTQFTIVHTGIRPMCIMPFISLTDYLHNHKYYPASYTAHRRRNIPSS